MMKYIIINNVPCPLDLLHAIQINARFFACQWPFWAIRPRWFWQLLPESNPLVLLSKTVSPKLIRKLCIIIGNLCKKTINLTVFLFFLIVFPLVVASFVFGPFTCRILGSGTRFVRGGANGLIIGDGAHPIGGGGGGIQFPIPRGAKSSLSSSDNKSVKSKSHNFNGLVMFFINSSQCNSFSDFFGSCFLISWSLLGELILIMCARKNGRDRIGER